MMFLKVDNKGLSTYGPHISAPVCKFSKSKFDIIHACSYSLGNKVLGIKT